MSTYIYKLELVVELHSYTTVVIFMLLSFAGLIIPLANVSNWMMIPFVWLHQSQKRLLIY